MLIIQILGFLLSVAVVFLVCYYALLLIAEYFMSAFGKKKEKSRCNCRYPWDYL